MVRDTVAIETRARLATSRMSKRATDAPSNDLSGDPIVFREFTSIAVLR